MGAGAAHKVESAGSRLDGRGAETGGRALGRPSCRQLLSQALKGEENLEQGWEGANPEREDQR